MKLFINMLIKSWLNLMNEAKVRTRHLKYFSQLAEQAETALRGPDQAEWYERLDEERDNIRAALNWADQTDVEGGLYIAGRLERFWESFDLREGILWLGRFLQKTVSRNYLTARARALQAYAQLLLWFQQFTEARIAAEEGLEIQRTHHNRSGEIDILLLLENIMNFSGELEAGLDLTQQAYILSQALHDTWRQATALSDLGYYHREHSSYWEEASILFRQVGDWRSLSSILSRQAFLHALDGDFASAEKNLNEVASMGRFYQRLGPWTNTNETIARSMIALAQGDYEQACALIRSVMVRADELGNRMNYLWARVRFGHVVLRLGNLHEARAVLIETAREFQNDNFVIGVVFSLEGMAELYVAIGKPECAIRLIGWADATRKRIDDMRRRIEQADVDKTIAACIAKVGEIAFTETYQEGQKMTLDEAVACALGGN
jgi:tetratricopeptide (TPR) repeat protein